MDTWFTTEPMVSDVLGLGLDVIGMVKQLRQRYCFNGKLYILPEWIRRNEYDRHSYGELFHLLCDGVQDMDLTTVLQGLVALFSDFCWESCVIQINWKFLKNRLITPR